MKNRRAFYTVNLQNVVTTRGVCCIKLRVLKCYNPRLFNGHDNVSFLKIKFAMPVSPLNPPPEGEETNESLREIHV
jgi:hypothetical protein